MTIAVFTISLLGGMALGMPIASPLLICGVALMVSLDISSTRRSSRKVRSTAPTQLSRCWRCRSSAAGRRDHDQAALGAAHRHTVAPDAGRSLGICAAALATSPSSTSGILSSLSGSAAADAPAALPARRARR